MNNQCNRRFNIIILYDKNEVFINTIREYLESFVLFSQNHVHYAHATHDTKCQFDLELFDVVVIHYSVRLSIENHISPFYAEAISDFKGLKVLFIQDEYENTETARNWIEKLGINVVFSCVPQEYHEQVYPKSRFPNVEFISILTGYVPISLESKNQFKPISERKIVFGYRGKELPYWYGNLGREKLIIGKIMKNICQEQFIDCDISWNNDQRIYGDKWYEFIEGCRVTLGTESGSNVFDDYGNLKTNVEIALKENPALSYEDIYYKYIAPYEGKVIMNQISPKIFEAIALKTGLVLFEGNYSGVIQPGVHYIPLKKDLSNIDEVMNKVLDSNYLEKLVNQAHHDIVESGKYSYRSFIKRFDKFISSRIKEVKNISPLLINEKSYTWTEISELKKDLNNIEIQLNLKLEEIQSLKNVINYMESSKFWKLRAIWLKIKNFL